MKVSLMSFAASLITVSVPVVTDMDNVSRCSQGLHDCGGATRSKKSGIRGALSRMTSRLGKTLGLPSKGTKPEGPTVGLISCDKQPQPLKAGTVEGHKSRTLARVWSAFSGRDNRCPKGDAGHVELQQRHLELTFQLATRRTYLDEVKAKNATLRAELDRVKQNVFELYTWHITDFENLKSRVKKYEPILHRVRAELTALRQKLCRDLNCEDHDLDRLLIPNDTVSKGIQTDPIPQPDFHTAGQAKIRDLQNALCVQRTMEDHIQTHVADVKCRAVEDAPLVAALRRRVELKERLSDLRENRVVNRPGTSATI